MQLLHHYRWLGESASAVSTHCRPPPPHLSCISIHFTAILAPAPRRSARKNMPLPRHMTAKWPTSNNRLRSSLITAHAPATWNERLSLRYIKADAPRISVSHSSVHHADKLCRNQCISRQFNFRFSPVDYKFWILVFVFVWSNCCRRHRHSDETSPIFVNIILRLRYHYSQNVIFKRLDLSSNIFHGLLAHYSSFLAENIARSNSNGYVTQSHSGYHNDPPPALVVRLQSRQYCIHWSSQ